MKKVSVVLAITKTTIILPFFLSRLRGKRKERSGEISKEKMVVLVEDISVGAYRLIIESPPFGLLAFGPPPQLFAEKLIAIMIQIARLNILKIERFSN